MENDLHDLRWGDNRKAIIVDIDGTLTDATHRLHHIKKPKGEKKDWPAFFDAMGDDPPTAVTWFLDNFLSSPGMLAPHIILCSGRPESHRDVTLEWLEKHARRLSRRVRGLCMRPNGVYISDVELKRGMLQGLRAAGYDIRLVIDDRPDVIQMWKEEGLTVLEINSGNWD